MGKKTIWLRSERTATAQRLQNDNLGWKYIFLKRWHWLSQNTCHNLDHGAAFSLFNQEMHPCALQTGPQVQAQKENILEPQPFQTYIQGLCDTGRLDKALGAVSRMDLLGTVPPSDVFLILLKACTKAKSLAHTSKVHALLVGYNADSAGLLGDYLVVALARCGALVDANRVFVSLRYRTVFSWTAMISAYTEFGQGREALKLQSFMQHDGVEPDQHTYVGLLQACATISDLQEAERLHVEAQRKGFMADSFVANALVVTYGKCGSISEAENVFIRSLNRDGVSWNSMLSVYVEQGETRKAFLLYRQMQEQRVDSCQRTFVLILEACAIAGGKEELTCVAGDLTNVLSWEIGRALHADARRKGFTSCVFVSSTLVNMYGLFKHIVEAETVFDDLQECNLVLWNAMLSAYVEQGQVESSLWCYRQMQEEGCIPCKATFAISLEACNTLLKKREPYLDQKIMGILDIGRALHADASRMGYSTDSSVGSSLLTIYGMYGNIGEAENVFNGLSEHNPITWHNLLAAYVMQGRLEKALCLYRQMQEEKVIPKPQAFTLAFHVCSGFLEKGSTLTGSAKAVSLEIGKSLHADAKRQGFTSDTFVGNALINMYGKCGGLAEAENVFIGLLERDILSLQLMLSAYVEHREGEKALQLFSKMQKEQVPLNDIITNCVLQACCETSRLETCMQSHFQVICAGYDHNLFLENTLIRAYGSCGSMEDAAAVFCMIPQYDLVSWNAFLSGYAQQGNITACLQVSEEMQPAGMLLDGVTYMSLLTACCHASLVNKGVEIFECMIMDNGLAPSLKHYLVILDILGRAGDFQRVENILLGLPLQADLAVWLCWLGACRMHTNVDMGKYAFDCVVNVDSPEISTAYVLMSNLCVENRGQESWR